MIVKSLDFCMDGGTAVIKTDQGDYYIDRRLKTETENAIYDAHPDEGGKLVEGVTKKIVEALIEKPRGWEGDQAIRILIRDLSRNL